MWANPPIFYQGVALAVNNVWLQVFKGWMCPVGVGKSDVNTEQKPEQNREETKTVAAKIFQA